MTLLFLQAVRYDCLWKLKEVMYNLPMHLLGAFDPHAKSAGHQKTDRTIVHTPTLPQIPFL